MNQINGYFFYTDGGARPNPGAAGYGAHGCYYAPARPKKGMGLNNIRATPFGYMSKKDTEALVETLKDQKISPIDPAAWYGGFTTTNAVGGLVNPWHDTDIGDSANLIDIEPIEFIDMDFSFGDRDLTNNYAEILAACAVLEFVKTHYEARSCGFVYVQTDSNHVVEGIGWVDGWRQRGWRTAQGNPVKNLEEWQRLDRLNRELLSMGVLVIFKHVKAHIGNYGNELADRLATGAVARSNDMRENDYASAGSVGQTDISPAAGYWKTDIETHPFINHPTMFFNTHDKYRQPGIYALGRRTKDFHLQGKRDAQDAYAVVRLMKPIEIADAVMQRQIELDGDGDELYVLHYNRITTPYVYRDWLRWGRLAFYRGRAWLKDLVTLDDVLDTPITRHFRVTGLAYRTGEAIDKLASVLSAAIGYYNKDEAALNADPTVELTVTDITGIFYETKMVKKNKTEVETLELRSKYKPGHVSESVKARYNVDGVEGEQSVILTFGIDIPDRNALKRIQEIQPTVYLVTWPGSPHCFLHAVVIIGANGDAGVWCGYYSNICFVTQQPTINP